MSNQKGVIKNIRNDLVNMFLKEGWVKLTIEKPKPKSKVKKGATE